MVPLLLPLRIARTYPHGISSQWTIRLRTLQQLPRNASSTRSAPRKHVAATPSKHTPGAFRPELLRFLNKQEPTILVESHPPTAYRIGMFMLAGFCIAYGVINCYSILYNSPHPVSSFVRGTNVSIDIAMAAFGALTFYKTVRIISRVTAVPYVTNRGTGQKGLMLRIETYPAIPFPGRGRKTTEIPADLVTTSDRLGIPGIYNSTPIPPTRDEKIAERMWIREQRRKEHQYNMSRILTLPFREAGHWIGRGFLGLRDMMAGDGFVHLKAKGRNGTWKVSRDFDWALDSGHAFDKVVKVDVW